MSSFGGFGSSNTTGGGFGGFGSTTTGGGFGGTGTTSSGGGLFGNNTATAGGFGSTGGGFGTNTSPATTLGAKPATTGFGSTNTNTGGGMFGGGASTTGGFGSTGSGFGATNTASSGFGANNTSGGGLFGNKPATTTGGFGSTNTGSIFGGGANNTSTGFGATNTTSTPAFGGAASTGGFGATNTNTTTGGFGGFGASNNTAQTNNGTAGTPFQAFQEKDGATTQTSHYQSITFQQPYQNKSFEELRVEDYMQGRRYGNSNGQAGSFGTSTGFGGSLFGGNNNTTQTTGSSLFGGNNTATANTSTGFGGFGSNNNTAQPAASGFGATNTGGGLFGSQQNKPAGGLFGSTPAASTGGFGATNTNTGGGLFGANNTSTNSGFGANNTANTGGGLFGSQNNNTAAKPAFGGFGQTGTSTGFGATANTNTGGGLFGNTANNNTNTGSGLFGSNNTTQQQNSNPFGGSTNTGGSSLFGNNNQAKPATGGLFGSTPAASTTGGGLFGNNNNTQQQSGGLFGSQPANNAGGGGLFGNNNNQNKATTGGLFGSTPANNNTGGGLFGNSTNTNTNTGGGLFGSTNTNNAGGSSLFGNNNNKPAGSLFGGGASTNNNSSSLFGGLGGNNQQQATGGSSLFGSTNQQNNNNGNSMFGGMNQSNNANQSNQLTASLTISPYGNDQLFSSLGQSSAPVGPLATPLAGARPTPAKTPSLLSSSRLNSPIYTPRASTVGRPGGYGFSYSAYGTPGSAYSVSLTPQASSLLKPTGSLGSALTSRLAKSMSMNNLRGDTPSRDGESLLRPTPGSASSRYLNSGSMRKLTIDRSLRTDLFSPPTSSNLQRIENAADQQSPGLQKKVSFENSAAPGARQTDATPNAGNALVRTESEEDDSPRVTRSQAKANGAPEMEQVNGSKSLTDIPEDAEPQRPASAPTTKRPAEKVSKPSEGDYWCEPPLKDLQNMSRTQRSKLKIFTVGRHGVGKIEFRNNGKGIDLSKVDLDRVYDPNDMNTPDGPDAKGIVCLKIRKATVYPNANEKPPEGQALNVPSRIWLEQSWPRKDHGKTIVKDQSGPRLQKHIQRLHKIVDTTFVEYEPATATWVFDVPHYTTYELDDDSDDETENMEGVQQESSELSEPPATLPHGQQDDTMQSIESNNGDVDDTFEFKLNRSKSSMRSSHIPGGFDEPSGNDGSYEYDDSNADQDEDMDELHQMSGGLGDAYEEDEDLFAAQGGAVQAPSPGAYERYGSSMALDNPGPNIVAETAQADSESEEEPPLPGSFNAEEPKMLRSILKPTAPISRAFASPEKLANDTWEEQLQRTMSPRKRDRQALKGLQQSILRGDRDDFAESPFKRSMLGQSVLGQSYLAQKSAKKVGFGSVLGGKQDLDKSQAFRTSMDLMNSLWAQEKSSTRGAAGTKGFEKPYTKTPRVSTTDESDENPAFHQDGIKPSFAANSTLVYSVLGSVPEVDFPLEPALRPLIGEHTEVRFARFAPNAELNTETLTHQKTATTTSITDGFPAAHPNSVRIDFTQLAEKSSDSESTVWQLCNILFESVRTGAGHLTGGMTDEQILAFEPRLRKDAVKQFWVDVVNASTDQAASNTSAEEKALLFLTRGDKDSAADVLANSKNFRLATLVAQLPSTENSRRLMAKQIEAWKNRNDWTEMSDPIRALYSILAGEVCVVQGKNGPKEDRVSEFVISERFDLNWIQSLSLRLFFGGYDTLDEVVKSYVQDLDDGREVTLPTPSWTAPGTSEEELAGRQDTLFGLLRLYSTTRADPADLEALFDPHTVSGSPVNSRLAWQLAIILSAKGWTDYINHATLDQLTRGFAAELENTNKFVTASWVLLHLTEPKAREHMVKELLLRNSAKIPDPYDGDEPAETNVYHQLTHDNKIPSYLLYEAKALHAKAALQRPTLQARYLLNAGLLDEAHSVLTSTIGPSAVIEEDYDELIDILSHFPEDGNGVKDWATGGAVYSNFATLVTMNLGRKSAPQGRQTMQALKLGLEAMANADASATFTLEEKVAMLEMGKILKEESRDLGVENVVGAAIGESHQVEGLFERYQAAMGIVV